MASEILKPVLVCVLIALPCQAGAQPLDIDPAYERIGDDEDLYGAVLKSSIWKFESGQKKLIFLCWENPDEKLSKEMGWVRAAVEETWQKDSGLTFIGWDKTCKNEPDAKQGTKGVHIRIADEAKDPADDIGPHVKVLGNKLDRMKDGMVLNFTYTKWFKSCPERYGLELCIKTVAIHEFGHALGFAHEHNRPDTPGECTAFPQGTTGDKHLTPYDPKSVMNYCNPEWGNFGKLTKSDISSVQMLYCTPKDPLCTPAY